MTDELAELRNELERLQQRVVELESERDENSVGRAEVALPREAVTRRNWMKAAAAAAVGGSVAAVASSQPVAAANGDPIRIGQTTTGTNRTVANYTGGGQGVGFLFQSGDTFSGAGALRPAALAGFANNAAQPSGIYGFTNVNSADAAGVDGVAGAANGTGVRGRGGESAPGLDGTGGTYGVQASGDVAAVNLIPSSTVPPTETTDFHQGGELYVREVSDSGLAVELWYCTVGGTPGSWTQIAGPFVSGGFYPITPTRVYDSRRPTPDPGALAAGTSRDVDVSQGVTCPPER